jgi:hypothetical protein
MFHVKRRHRRPQNRRPFAGSWVHGGATNLFVTLTTMQSIHKVIHSDIHRPIHIRGTRESGLLQLLWRWFAPPGDRGVSRDLEPFWRRGCLGDILTDLILVSVHVANRLRHAR